MKTDIADLSPDPSGSDDALARAAVLAVFRALGFALPDFPFLSDDVRMRLARDVAGGDLCGPLASGDKLDTALARLPEGLRDRYRADTADCLLVGMATSEEVPLSLVDEVSDAATARLAELLRDHYGLAPDRASYLAAEARLAALVRAMEAAPRERMEARLVELRQCGLLTGDKLVAFARRGNSPAFFAGVGAACDMTSEMVEGFLEENGVIALRHILQRGDMAPAVRRAICDCWVAAAGSAAD